MYADLGPGLETEISPPSPDGSSIFYSHGYVANRMRRRAANRSTGSSRIGKPGRAFQSGDALNLYRYVGNSPPNVTDPSGLGFESCWWDCEVAIHQTIWSYACDALARLRH